MIKSILLLIVSTTLVICQESDTYWNCLRFAELSSVQIEVVVEQENIVSDEGTLKAKVFAEILKQIPQLKVDITSKDKIYVHFTCVQLDIKSASEPYYFGAFTMTLCRPARLLLNNNYYYDADPTYFTGVWEESEVFSRSRDGILSMTNKSIEEYIGKLAYEYNTSTNELQKIIGKYHKKK